MSDHELDPTYPAQAQFRVLRCVAGLAHCLAEDLADAAKRSEIEDLFTAKPELSVMERKLITRALDDLAAELRLRAEMTWDSNLDYISAFLKMTARRN